MPEKLLQLRTPSRNGVVLELSMTLKGDRFATELAVVNGATRIPLVRSIEGDNRDLWPPSPPMQEVVPQTTEGVGDYLAGIGRAGKSTWSVIIAPVELDSGEVGFEFDFACRVTTPPERVGSIYEPLAGEVQLTEAGVIVSFGETRLQGDLLDGELVRPQDREIGFAAVPDGNASLPGTLRWKYQWLLA